MEYYTRLPTPETVVLPASSLAGRERSPICVSRKISRGEPKGLSLAQPPSALIRSISFPSNLRPVASNLRIFIQLRTLYPQWSASTPFPSITSALFPIQRRGRGWFLSAMSCQLSLEEALRGYTVEAAYAEFQEQEKGIIEKGKLADLTVISKDITKIPAPEILSIRVLKTFVGGKLVYDVETSY